ncbi:MAG: hypothetical protein V7K41_20890 [Nostoc sp.]|uniref:hypothetical protein n=1 Tax=Nostoc sp. TaxID=1180 RepID=UPI002FF909AE
MVTSTALIGKYLNGYPSTAPDIDLTLHKLESLSHCTFKILMHKEFCNIKPLQPLPEE